MCVYIIYTHIKGLIEKSTVVKNRPLLQSFSMILPAVLGCVHDSIMAMCFQPIRCCH